MKKGGFFANHNYWGVVYTECQREKKNSCVFFLWYMSTYLKRLTCSHEELTFMRTVWKPYITRSASSHGCFSVHSARANFTVLKQLMVQKEYVMSCREI